MPLTFLVASLVRVVAGVVMLAAARGPASRAAHAVMLAVMVVLTLGMQSPFLSICCAVVLLATAGVLIRLRPDAEARLCALDVAACAALVALMGASSLTAHAGPSPSSMDMAGMHTSGPNDPVLAAIPIGATFLLVGGWAMTRRRARRAGRPSGVAAWLMMLGMAAMVTT